MPLVFVFSYRVHGESRHFLQVVTFLLLLLLRFSFLLAFVLGPLLFLPGVGLEDILSVGLDRDPLQPHLPSAHHLVQELLKSLPGHRLLLLTMIVIVVCVEGRTWQSAAVSITRGDESCPPRRPSPSSGDRALGQC